MNSGAKRALVTGGSGGIGAAICRRLAADGLHVYVHANRRLEEARKLAGEIEAAGGQAQAIAFDVADREKTVAGLEKILEGGGRSRSSSTTPASTTTRCCRR
jgi:3-oxoacyl-[acyl-carrier protein] reductase